MRLSACIEWLFGEDDAPLPERVHRARAAGLAAVEFWGWRDKDLDGIQDALRQTGLALASFVSEPMGRLTDRSTHKEFLDGVESSAAVAARLGCPHLIVVSGDELDHHPRREQRQAVVDGLTAAAPIARRHGVTLVLEPINRLEEPRILVSTIAEGLAIVEAVSDANVGLLCDLFHAAVMGEDAQLAVAQRMGHIAHVHVADFPGRHEPGTGGVDWPDTLRWLAGAGYRGLVGLEYMPSRPTEESLQWIKHFAASLD